MIESPTNFYYILLATVADTHIFIRYLKRSDSDGRAGNKNLSSKTFNFISDKAQKDQILKRKGSDRSGWLNWQFYWKEINWWLTIKSSNFILNLSSLRSLFSVQFVWFLNPRGSLKERIIQWSRVGDNANTIFVLIVAHGAIT